VTFPNEPSVIAVVLWHLVVGAIASRPYIAWRRRTHRTVARSGETGVQNVWPGSVADPLPSWEDTGTKQLIRDFVARVTRPGQAEFIPASDRVAVFDNDGTLWCEQPMQVQLYFALDRMRDMAKRDPSLYERQPFKAFLERDTAAIAALGKQAAFQLGFATHAGMTAEQFEAAANRWLSSARHPQLGRLFTESVYQPQLELLDFLRAHGFRTFIVSGGGIDLIRAFAEAAYGIPREHVVGSSVKTRLSLHDGRADVVKLAELDTFDDREKKVENIYLHIGRRPALAFGNSDGDLAMLRYTVAGDRAGLALLLHHDDAAREYAYDADFRLSPLVEGLAHAGDYGINLVSMKNDWRSVFRNGSH
jgi:phosphoserine phosphatase